MATVKICDRIFSRVSNRDCLESNSSTFKLEMQEVSYILANVTEKSLVILDELGRGTSVTEGTAVCWA
jgi:DNA mismatch repair protein MSH4